MVQPRVSPFISPAAGAAREQLGPDPKELNMGPAPKVASKSTTAEIVELYWMAAAEEGGGGGALTDRDEEAPAVAGVSPPLSAAGRPRG
jgi:hypothetical protein